MDDVPVMQQSRRRKQWVAVGVGAVVAIAAACLWRIEDEEMRRARSIHLGQDMSEVRRIMKSPHGLGFGRSVNYTMVYGHLQKAEYDLLTKLRQSTGVSAYRFNVDAWPIIFHFDANGRVDRIKRGSEIIER